MDTEPQKISQISLRDIITIFFKHKWKILGVFLGTVTVVTIGSFLMDPTYEAESTVMVKMGREHVYQPEVGSASPAVAFDQERILESEIQILTSRDLLKRVIESIGVEKIYPDFNYTESKIPPLEKSIIQMQKDLSIADVKSSNVIRIAYQHHDPEIAANAVNLLIDFLLERHLQIFSNPKAEFLENQVVARQEKLNTSREKLQDFKQKHGISSLHEEERLLLQQHRDLDTSLKTVQNDREGLKSKLGSLLNQIPHIPKHISLTSVSERQKVIDEAKSNLLKLRLKEQELSTRFKKTSRFVKNILNEIAMTQAFIHE
ncbi:MAG: GumC family protein, partial [Nitrospirales bacterium]